MEGVEKSFGATRALSGVSLDVAPGDVHALIGENGAGKSTLMKILAGVLTPDAGRMSLFGSPYRPTGPLDARRRGVAMIHQELTLAPHLDVEANLTLGTETTTFGFVRRAGRRAAIRDVLTRLRLADLPLDTPVGTLSTAVRQLLEIARALLSGARVVIMDEPTSSLGRRDVERLFDIVRELAASGCGIIYISHFMDELRDVATRFTVLRDGASVGTGTLDAVDDDALIRL
ncbi:MAG: Ribose import ATP-binding protein RbsA, partial [Planctomycetota bacterium]